MWGSNVGLSMVLEGVENKQKKNMIFQGKKEGEKSNFTFYNK